jgi:class 3 adenylate cyclase
VIDDLHWADSSTRELLEYAARRLGQARVMFLATYRSDELDRTHPLTRAVQTWRRSGFAEVVAVEPMSGLQAAEMVATILGEEEPDAELVAFVHERAEGNPFVLEEMLREALDRGEVVELPETVRDAVLLRLNRLDDGHVAVLRSAALLGRSFEYELLVDVAEEGEPYVLAALEAAVSLQLLDEADEARGLYTWRHALTQEAIETDTVLPKRLAAHSRAADALIAAGGSALAVARHLLAAARPEEAVAACLRAADEAERAAAFVEASELLERVLPHVSDDVARTLLLYRMGRLRWFNAEPTAAEQLLAEAVPRLDELGLADDAAEARIYLGRCYWERDRPADAMKTFEEARAALEQKGASAELALVHLRIAGLHAFQLDDDNARVAAEHAAAVAEEAGADFERLWARSFVALSFMGTRHQLELFDSCFQEATEKGYTLVVGNIFHNETWARVHTLAGDLGPLTERYERMPIHPWALGGLEIARSWAHLAEGEPRTALDLARAAIEEYGGLENPKYEWRAHLALAEALLELGRPDEAAEELPPPSPGAELQDVVYDSAARIGIALALGRPEEAAELGRRATSDDRLFGLRSILPVAVEGLLAGGALKEARAAVERARAVELEVGEAGLEFAEGLVAGEPAAARAHFERALTGFRESGLRLWAWRAAARTGNPAEIEACIVEAHRAGAVRARDAAIAAARELGLELPQLEEDVEPAELDAVQAGERLVTSMFADVRGYTPIAVATAPEELADRLTTLHRWAAAEVGKRQGIVDKFAGDAVMATFNATGARIDHATQALEAALALRDKAALMDLPLGIGIAVGPAVVSRSVDDANVSVLGATTNLAARLQAAAGGGDILLSDEAYRRVASWLEERGLMVAPEHLELKGFDGRQPAYRLAGPGA